MKTNRLVSRAIVALVGALLIPAVSQAQSGIWTSASSGNWSDINNWNFGSGPVASGAGNTADFSTLDLSADIYVTNDVPRTIGNMIFADATPDKWWYIPSNSIITLDAAGGTPTITVSNMAVVFRTVLAGSSGLLKNGAGALNIDSLNTYSGGTMLGEGTIGIGTVGVGHLGTGLVTITNGSTLLMYRSDTSDNSTVGSFTNGIYIPTGEMGTIWCSARSVSGAAGSASTFTPTVTGGGTLTMRINNPASRAGNAANFSTFTGILNVTRRNAADTYAVAFAGTTAPGFPNARINLAAGVTMNQWLNPPSTSPFTTTHTIGELSGEVGSALGGNPVSGRFVNWAVGALNTTATFAGTIRNDAGAAMITKVGTGAWILSGTNTYTGATLISAGKLVGVTGGSISNTASFTVASGATNAVVVATPNGRWTTTNLIYSAGTSCLELNLGGLPSTTVAPLRVRGALTANGTVNVNVYAGNVTAGATYPLVEYDTLAGGGFSAFALTMAGPHFTAHLVDNAGSKRIDLVVDSVTQPLRWATGSGDWDISSTANWIDTTSASTTYQEIAGLGDAVVFEDSASGAAPITVTLNTNASPATVTVSNATKDFTFTGTGRIGGNASLIKLGASPLTLGLTNTYTAGTVIGGGTVSLSTPVAGGLGTGTVTLTNGSILSLYRGDATDDGNVSYFSNPLTVPVGETGTVWTSPRSRTGSAGTPSTFTPTVTGAGTLNLRVQYVGYIGGDWSGFSGLLNVTPRTAAESFQIANGAAVASGFPNATVHLNPGVTMIQVVNPPNTGSLTTVQPIGALSGDVGSLLSGNPVSGRYVNWVVGSKNTDATFAGDINDSVGAAQITKVGTGTWTWTGSALHSGATVISNGTLAVNGTVSYSPVTVAGSGTLAGTGTLGAPVTVNAGGSVAAAGGSYGSLAFNGGLFFNGGTNVVDISNADHDVLNVSGGLNLTAGTVRLNVSGTLANGTYPLMQYDYITGGAAGNLSIVGFNQPGQVASLADTGLGQVNLVVSTASSANLTWIGDGSLNWWDVNSSTNWTNGSAMTVFQSGDKVTFNDTGSKLPDLDIRTAVQPGLVTVNATQDYTFASSTGGKITGPTTALVKSGSGTLTVLTLNENGGGTLINGGKLQVGNGGMSGDLGPANITNNAQLVFQQYDSRSVSGIISGSGGVEQNGSATLTFAANNTYSGGTTIGGGATLQVGAGAASGSLGTGQVTNNGTLIFNRSGSYAVANVISGGGGIIKTNASTLTLSGANSYEGNSFISQGVLKLGAAEVIPDGGTTTGWLILDGGATAGVFDLNGFNESVNALAGLTGASLGVVTNSAASGTNLLAVGNDLATTTFAGLITENPVGAKVALIKRGTGQLTLATANSYSGGTVVSNGTLAISQISALGTGTVKLAGGTLNIGAFKPANTIESVAPSTVSGGSGGGTAGIGKVIGNSTVNIDITTGVFDLIGDLSEFSGTLTLGASGGVRLNGTAGSSLAAFDFGPGTASVSVRNPPRAIAFGALSGGSGTSLSGDSASAGTVTYTIGAKGTNTTYSGALGNGTFSTPGLTAIVKVGPATQTFDGTLSYGGGTTVSNGVLAINGAALLTNSSPINVVSGGTLDLSGSAGGGLNLGDTVPQTLTGGGNVLGTLTVGANSTVSPGDGVGTLTVSGVATINGVALMQLNRTNSPATNDLLVAPVINAAGTLTVTNVGPALCTGDQFKLFSVPVSGTFTTVNLPQTFVQNGVTNNYVWTNKLAVDGTIEVVSGFVAVDTTPTNITSVLVGNNLTLSWPADHTGWTLLTQTNSLGAGLTTNWFEVPGSKQTNAVTITINPANPTVFFKLAYP